MPDTTAAELENYGSIASDAYMHKQTPLNDSITKIAQENRLNREQIQRVCEFANLKAFDDQIKTASDKRLEFPLADYKEVVARIKDIPDVEVKTASFNTGFSKLAFFQREEDINPISGTSNTFLGAQSLMEKLASSQVISGDQIMSAFIKLGEYKDKLRMTEIEYESKDESIKTAMTDMVKDMIQDGHSFEDLYKAAVASVPAEKMASIKNLFEDVGERLKKAGVIYQYKLAFDRVTCQAYNILKIAEIKDKDAGEHKVKNLKARSQVEMFTNDYCKNEQDRALTTGMISEFEKMYQRVRGLVKDKISGKENK